MDAMRKIIITICVVVCGALTAWSQDIHFSQYNLSPMSLNPAMTGFFQGHYRLTANYRSQWGAANSKYETYSAGFDFSLFKDKLREDYFGIGAYFFRDQAGDLNFNTTQVNLHLAYSKGFGDRVKHSIALGFSGGFYTRGINQNAAIFPETPEGIPLNSLSDIDFSTGILWHIVPRERLNMYVGFAYHHLNKPKNSFFQDPGSVISPKYAVSAGAVIEVGNSFNLLPSILYARQNQAQQVNFGTYLQYIFGDDLESDAAISFGLFARLSQPAVDAVIPTIRLDVSGFTLGFSYDVNVSELSGGTNGRGALEVALVYTGSFKRVRNYRKIYCPTF
jgi:type IX secretion system PorP/SprF family membrane protein